MVNVTPADDAALADPPENMPLTWGLWKNAMQPPIRDAFMALRDKVAGDRERIAKLEAQVAELMDHVTEPSPQIPADTTERQYR